MSENGSALYNLFNQKKKKSGKSNASVEGV